MLGMLAKAAIYRPPQTVKSVPTLPQQIENLRHTILPAHYEHFHQLVKWPASGQGFVHPNYIQVLTLPMQLTMMTKFPFPFRPLGLVHVANKINVLNLPRSDSTLDLNTYFGDHYAHKKGVVFELHSEASQNGVVAVKATSYYLARTQKPVPASVTKFENEKLLSGAVELYNKSDAIALGKLNFQENSGRQYAKVSGDYNPIHLWPATSRLFGFNRAIAHGMHSHALCISKLQEAKHCDFSVNRSIKAIFKQPISLPGCTSLSLNHDIARCNLSFALSAHNEKSPQSSISPLENQRVHVLGMVNTI